VCKNDLKLKSYKKQQSLPLHRGSESCNSSKSRQRFVWHAGDDIYLSDDWLLLLQETHNPTERPSMNDRVCSVSLWNILRKKIAVKRFQNRTNHNLGCHFEKRQVTPTFHINGSSSLETCQKFAWRRQKIPIQYLEDNFADVFSPSLHHHWISTYWIILFGNWGVHTVDTWFVGCKKILKFLFF
jgi:hypothetical protein